MADLKIGVVGGGVVGGATARVWMEWGDVRVYDVVKERATHTLEDVLQCDLVFVCLPTPQGPDGRLVTSFVDEFFARADVKAADTNYVLRSTVPVGTTKRLRETHSLQLCHSPEFLTARCAVVDAFVPARNIIGGEHGRCRAELIRQYQKRFPGVNLLVMTSDASEFTKLFQNSNFAVKISMFNEAHAYCVSRGIDWQQVLAGVLSDGRISHAHTRVPGPNGSAGWGGVVFAQGPLQLHRGAGVGGRAGECVEGCPGPEHLRPEKDVIPRQ